MGVFDDKKFEQLDWMTQITETIDSKLNSILAGLPDRIEIDEYLLLKTIGESYNLSLSVSDLVGPFLRKERLGYEEQRMICDCFEFEASQELKIDFKEMKIHGHLAMVKIKHTFDDHELQPLMGAEGIAYVHNLYLNEVNVSRANEILDILGKNSDEVFKSKSRRKKIKFIKIRLRDIFKNNEWRIRNTELANNVGVWIADYIRNGTLVDLTNICKLKAMTHKGGPIYSMEIEK